MPIRAFGRKLVLSVALGVAVVLAVAVYGNADALFRTLEAFEWSLVPLILGLTLLNYGLRFVKWNMYLQRIEVSIDRRESLAIFLSGLAMAMTPGKIGEVLKPILLRNRTGTPLSKSIPIVVAERLTDGLAMLILAFGGLILSHQAWQVLVASLLLSVFVLLGLGSRRGADILLRLGRRLPGVGSRISHLELFLASSRSLFDPRTLCIAVGIGVVSWSGEGIALYLVLLGLGLHSSFSLALNSLFVLSVASLVGSLSMLPGGLGAAEASVASLLLLVARVARVQAAAATLLIRFCTLWFGVAVGLATLFLTRHMFDPQVSRVDDPTESVSATGIPT